VACTGGTQLGLGLLDLDGLSEQVLLTLSGVLLNELSHWRRSRNGSGVISVDTDHGWRTARFMVYSKGIRVLV